jgi:hypothetical protein
MRTGTVPDISAGIGQVKADNVDDVMNNKAESPNAINLFGV